MSNTPKLIVMLTYNDETVKNAYEIFDSSKDAKAEYWGMKEEPLPYPEMKELYRYMKACNKRTVLEVVAYAEDECIAGAQMAADFGCEVLMGTVYFDSVSQICRSSGLKYLPFVGNITGRPSVLDGDIYDMISQANSYIAKGACGVDLLGYRYVGDAVSLNNAVVAEVNAPVCIAGSVNSFERLDEIKRAAPWAFTIGGAFFENKFGGTFREQIDTVCDYLDRDDKAVI